MPLTLPCDEMCLVTVFQYATTNPNLPFSTPFAPLSTLMRGLRKMGLKKKCKQLANRGMETNTKLLATTAPELDSRDIKKRMHDTYLLYVSL